MRRSEFLPLFFIALIAIGIAFASRQPLLVQKDTRINKDFYRKEKHEKNSKKIFDSVATRKFAKSFFSEMCVQCQVCELFAPRDDLKSVIIGLINAEHSKLQMAAFKFTDGDISKALIDAYERGVVVEIVADSSGLDTRLNQILRLHSVGIPVYVYPGPDFHITSRFSIMHNKFLICYESDLVDEMVVWTGSFNFTNTASHHNRENSVVIISDAVAKKYAQEFEILKKESQCLSKRLSKKDEALRNRAVARKASCICPLMGKLRGEG